MDSGGCTLSQWFQAGTSYPGLACIRLESLVQYFQEPDLEIRNESVRSTNSPEGLVSRLPTVLQEAVYWTCWQCGQAMAITDDACSRRHPKPDDKLAERLRDLQGNPVAKEA